MDQHLRPVAISSPIQLYYFLFHFSEWPLKRDTLPFQNVSGRVSLQLSLWPLLRVDFPAKMAVIAKETSAPAAISRGSEIAISVEVQLGLVSKCGGWDACRRVLRCS